MINPQVMPVMVCTLSPFCLQLGETFMVARLRKPMSREAVSALAGVAVEVWDSFEAGIPSGMAQITLLSLSVVAQALDIHLPTPSVFRHRTALPAQ